MLSWKALAVQELPLQIDFQLPKLPGGDLLLQIYFFFAPMVVWLLYPNVHIFLHAHAISTH